MFGLFDKDIPLTELLNGAIDIHNHILPGIDDGAQNVNESIELIKFYKELGITKFYATPHTMSDHYPNTNETINNALKTLNEALITNNLNDVKVLAASEYMIDHEFEELIDAKELLTLKGNHVLVEMSYLKASDNFNEVIYKLQLKGYTPILAHPERYLYYIDDDTIFTQMKNKGIKLQLNALSLSSYYGSQIKKKALKLLKNDMYDFIGLDTHKMKHIDSLKNVSVSKKNKGKVELLIQNNNNLY